MYVCVCVYIYTYDTYIYICMKHMYSSMKTHVYQYEDTYKAAVLLIAYTNLAAHDIQHETHI